MWIIERRRGNDNKLLSTYKYDTKEEAEEEHRKFRQANKFAGLGGQWRDYYTYPKEVKE